MLLQMEMNNFGMILYTPDPNRSQRPLHNRPYRAPELFSKRYVTF